MERIFSLDSFVYPKGKKVLLIGHGYWGKKILLKLQAKFKRDDIFVADIRWPKMEAIRGVNSIGTEYQSFLQSVDAVVIATPINTHYRIVEECIKEGKHVFCEKPLTQKVSQAETLYGLAKIEKVKLFTDLTFLYDHRIEDYSGKEISQITWSGPKSLNPEGGILWVLGPHPISLMCHLYKDKPIHVNGTITDDFVNVEYLFNYKPRLVKLTMDWREGAIRTRRIDYDGEQLSPLLLNTIPDPEPLAQALNHFFSAISRSDSKQTQGNTSMDVVEVLEWTENTLRSR